jgi:hypothetical protein
MAVRDRNRRKDYIEPRVWTHERRIARICSDIIPNRSMVGCIPFDILPGDDNNVVPPPVTIVNFLLLEDGCFMLFEDSCKIELES